MSPIRPENRARYPKDWKEIRARIMKRAGDRCEWVDPCLLVRCLATHGGKHPETGAIVVLTVAHLNHIPEDCRDENLRAWCQLHHNRYDVKHRAETRRRTREQNSGQLDMLKGGTS